MKKRAILRNVVLILVVLIILTLTAGCKRPMTTSAREKRLKNLLKDKYGEEFEIRELYDNGAVKAWCYPQKDSLLLFKAGTTLKMEEISKDDYLQTIACKKIDEELQQPAEKAFCNSFIYSHIDIDNTTGYITNSADDITIKMLTEFYKNRGLSPKITIEMFAVPKAYEEEYLFLNNYILKKIVKEDYPQTHINIYFCDEKTIDSAKLALEEWTWYSSDSTEDIFDIKEGLKKLELYFDENGNGYIYSSSKEEFSIDNYKTAREEILK